MSPCGLEGLCLLYFITRCALKQYTSTKPQRTRIISLESQPKVICNSNPEFRIYWVQASALDHFQNVVNLFTCRCQSFCQVFLKAAVDCMRNADKSRKVLFSTMVREVEN